jgi:hypothetical protein
MNADTQWIEDQDPFTLQMEPGFRPGPRSRGAYLRPSAFICGCWVQRNHPFSVVHWCGGVLGVVGKEVRWDELLRFKCDIDCCLG